VPRPLTVIGCCLQKAQKMQNWPRVLNQAKISLQSVLSSDSDLLGFNPSEDPARRLLHSNLRFAKQNKGQKWPSNFEVVVMHLSVHLKACLLTLGCSRLSARTCHPEAGAKQLNKPPPLDISLQPNFANPGLEPKVNELSTQPTFEYLFY
jgi:hypothetical protein